MDGSAGELNWELVGGEPVPGTPDAVLQVADSYRRRSLLALRATESVTAYANGAGSGWEGATADAFREGIARVGPEVSPMVAAATRAGNALAGFAQAMRTLQSRAADVLVVAQQADDARVLAEQTLEMLHAQHAASTAALQQARADWRDAQSQADASLAVGSPEAAGLQSRAHGLQIRLNDARNQAALVEDQITSVGSSLVDAESLLQSARTDAHRLTDEFRAAAATAAAALTPVAPFTGGAFGGSASATSTATAPVPPPAPSAVAARPSAATTAMPAAPSPALSSPAPVRPSVAAVPASPAQGSSQPADEGLSFGSPGGTVRVGSVLSGVRIGGVPIALTTVKSSPEVYQRYRRMGLQSVTARGAAMARALGFDGTIGGLGQRPTPTDHSSGLAIDLMTYDDVASGEALAQFFRENHEALGITYVIYNGRICSPRQDWAWRPYSHPAGRTDATAMHLDHVHISFDPVGNASAQAGFGVAG